MQHAFTRITRTRATIVATALLVAVFAQALVATEARAAAAPKNGLAATYYDRANFKQPRLTRTDAKINFAWGAKSPSKRIAKDTFSARWNGFLVAPRAGTYTFTARASDGVRVWIDGRLRINRWGRAARPRANSARLKLSRGRHAIRVEYFEHTGVASIQLLWSGPRIRTQVIPPTTFVPPAPPTAPAQPWSDPATWGGSVPLDGSAVTIPAGKHVLLDRDVSLANLTLDGTLTFARRDLLLEADWVLVHGTLNVGTEAAPFTQKATIRLRDLTAGENVMNMGDKVLGVMGGTLELHGPKRVAWTKLGATAAKGATKLTLASAPDWKVGDRIAIASTDFNAEQDDEATITAIDGAQVTIDTPLAYSHYGDVQTFAGSQLDERAEVALLTRGVTVEGEAESSKGGFGGQIMLMDGAVAHIEGTELQRVGQQGLLRRYPIHFHMLGDGGAGSYVRNSSIHHSNNRCLTIHGTNQASVTGNVCYKHAGHGIFLEDGAERGNTIAGNLGMGTHEPAEGKRLLPSDDSPATYWITNPDNIVRNNIAAGSSGHGFWLAFPEHPTGLFNVMFPGQARAMWNRRMAIREFSGNTAHSNGQDGLHFDRGPAPDGNVETTHHEAHENPADPESKSLVTTLANFTAWKNRDHGAWLRGTNHRMTGATFADNSIGATFASDESYLQDSLVIGETANTGTPERWEVNSGGVGRGGRSAPKPWDADFPIRGFEFYDGLVGVERTTFVNFRPWTTAGGAAREQSALGYLIDDDFSIHPRNFASGLRFVDAKEVYLETPEVGHDGDMSAVFLDKDGSVTGTAGRSVTTTNPFLYGSGCSFRADWNAQLCTGDYATLFVGGSTRASVQPVTITRPDGQVQTLRANTSDDATEASTSVLTNTAYRVAYNGGTPSRARFVLAHGSGRWVRVSIPHAQGFKVTRWGCNVGQSGSWCFGAAASNAALDTLNRSGYWYDDHGDGDPATGTLHLRLNAVNTEWDELVVE